MVKKLILPLIAVLVIGAIAYYFVGGEDEIVTGDNILTTVKQGKFEVFVSSTGELQAKKSEKIRSNQERYQSIMPTRFISSQTESAMPDA